MRIFLIALLAAISYAQTAKLINDVTIGETAAKSRCLFLHLANTNNLDNPFGFYVQEVYDLVDYNSPTLISRVYFNSEEDYRGQSFCIYDEWIDQWNRNSELMIKVSYRTLDSTTLEDEYVYCPFGGDCWNESFSLKSTNTGCNPDTNNMGVFATSIECHNSASMAACESRIFAFSSNYPSWGCRCCGSDEGTYRSNSDWNLYESRAGSGLGWNILRSNVECSNNANEVFLGTFASVDACGEACANRDGCTNFIYGKGSKAGQCWNEGITESACTNWEEDEYDFYGWIYHVFAPTSAPSSEPSPSPTHNPTFDPSPLPTNNPTSEPSPSPTSDPSPSPTNNPTFEPSPSPTSSPTEPPSADPSMQPSPSPTAVPSPSPTESPTSEPTQSPTLGPSPSPTSSPTESPSSDPSMQPSKSPSKQPTPSPTQTPSTSPTTDPTKQPSKSPSKQPTPSPTQAPSTSPTTDPTFSPTTDPTSSPTGNPSAQPSKSPSMSPTISIETRLSRLEEMMLSFNRQLSDLAERMGKAESNVGYIDDGLTTISTCAASYEPINKAEEDDDDAALTERCAAITNPCECVGACGWSTEKDMCGSASEHRTTCTECDTVEGCITGSCLTLSDELCPLEYNEMRLCQCNDQCRDFGNCCWDVTGCGGDNYERIGVDLKCDIGDSRSFKLDFTSLENCARRCEADDNCDHFVTDLHRFCLGCVGMPADEGIGFHAYRVTTGRRRLNLSLKDEINELRKLNEKLLKMNQELREDLMKS